MALIVDFHVHAGPHEGDTPSYREFTLNVLGSAEAVEAFNVHYSNPENLLA